MGEKEKKLVAIVAKLLTNHKDMLKKIERLKKDKKITAEYLKDFREDYDKRELRYHERMQTLEEQIKEMEKKVWSIEKWQEEQRNRMD